jgi:hypothetical protein
MIKEFVQPKMILNNREFLTWKERGRGGRAGGQAGQQVGIFKVRFERDVEIEGRYKEIERHGNKETQRQS